MLILFGALAAVVMLARRLPFALGISGHLLYAEMARSRVFYLPRL